jgi:hypothetical protein
MIVMDQHGLPVNLNRVPAVWLAELERLAQAGVQTLVLHLGEAHETLGPLPPFEFDVGRFPTRVELTCRECGATNQDHWYRSQNDTVLCAPCFEGRKGRRLAKEVKVYTKTNHPFDAWMP